MLLFINHNKKINCLLFVGPVDEFMKPVSQFFNLEPVGVERHHVRSPVLIVIPVKVFTEPFEHFGGVVAVQYALVQVRAVAAFVRLHVMCV